jgi:hypothetical protein
MVARTHERLAKVHAQGELKQTPDARFDTSVPQARRFPKGLTSERSERHRHIPVHGHQGLDGPAPAAGSSSAQVSPVNLGTLLERRGGDQRQTRRPRRLLVRPEHARSANNGNQGPTPTLTCHVSAVRPHVHPVGGRTSVPAAGRNGVRGRASPERRSPADQQAERDPGISLAGRSPAPRGTEKAARMSRWRSTHSPHGTLSAPAWRYQPRLLWRKTETGLLLCLVRRDLLGCECPGETCKRFARATPLGRRPRRTKSVGTSARSATAIRVWPMPSVRHLSERPTTSRRASRDASRTPAAPAWRT